MNIKINGETIKTNPDISISALLEIQKVEMPDMVSVELNEDILDRGDFDTTILKENDSVEFLYFMGGGSRIPRRHA